MCLAYPMKIDKINGSMASVSVGHIKSDVSICLVDGVKKGDYVLVHAGIAIEKIDEERATEILSLVTQLGQKIDAQDRG